MKVGRNEPCPCGSGKKHKHCCYDKELQQRQANAIAAKEEAKVIDEQERDSSDEDDSKKAVHQKPPKGGPGRISGKSGGRLRGPESRSKVQRGSQRGN